MSETTPDFDFLRSIPIFKGLTDKALKILLTNSTKALFHKGSDIFTIGDTVKNLYLVEIGEIEIYKYSLEGKKLHLWYCRRGDIFCLPSLYTEQVFTNATATQDTLLFVIPKTIVEKLLNDSPSFASDLLRCNRQTIGMKTKRDGITTILKVIMAEIRSLSQIRA